MSQSRYIVGKISTVVIGSCRSGHGVLPFDGDERSVAYHFVTVVPTAQRASHDRRENAWRRQLEAVSSLCCTVPSGMAWSSTFSPGRLRLGKTISRPRGSA